jgi:hypothetical protein
MPLMTRPARIESPSQRPRRPAYQAASPAQKLSERASSQMTTRIVSVSATFASSRMSRTASGGTASRRNRNSKRAVASHSCVVGRLPSSTSWTRLHEKTCVGDDRDNRTDDDEDGLGQFQGSPAVVDDQQTDQRDRRSRIFTNPTPSWRATSTKIPMPVRM